MVRACANASALQCIMMTELQILEPVTRPRLVAPQYIALAFSGAISNPGALAAGVLGSTALRRPLSAGALTRTYPPLPNITGILVDPSQLIRCELRSSVLCGVYRETFCEGPRHVFDPAINASFLHWMAVAPRAVGWSRTVPDRDRSPWCYRPLRRAKAQGRFCGQRRGHSQHGARWRVRSRVSLSARRRQRASAEAGARSRDAVPGPAQGTCRSSQQDREDARRHAGRAKEPRRLQVPDGDVEDPDGRAALRGRPRAGRCERLSWHGYGSWRPRSRQGRRQHPRRRGDALGDPAPGARREPGARAFHLLRPCPLISSCGAPLARQMTEETISMKLRWHGHSAFRIEAGAAKILIDPFLSDNPSWHKGWIGSRAGEDLTRGGGR